MPFMRRLIGGWWKARSSRSVWSIWADPTQISPWPASQKFGAFCGQIAPMVSVLPVVPVRKYCAVYYLAHDSYHGMEEVVGSIPTRSTSQSCVFLKIYKFKPTVLQYPRNLGAFCS